MYSKCSQYRTLELIRDFAGCICNYCSRTSQKKILLCIFYNKISKNYKSRKSKNKVSPREKVKGMSIVLLLFLFLNIAASRRSITASKWRIARWWASKTSTVSILIAGEVLHREVPQWAEILCYDTYLIEGTNDYEGASELVPPYFVFFSQGWVAKGTHTSFLRLFKLKIASNCPIKQSPNGSYLNRSRGWCVRECQRMGGFVVSNDIKINIIRCVSRW